MKTHQRFIALCSAVLLIVSSVSLAAQADDAAPVAPLRDQFGASGGLDVHAGEVQIVIVVTAKRLRRLKPWERELRENYPTLPLLRVADVPVSSPTEHEQVAKKLRKRLPEDVAVLIDLDSLWAQRFELDVSVPNLLVFDTQGVLRSVHAGFYKAERFAALQQDLNAVLALIPEHAATGSDQAP